MSESLNRFSFGRERRIRRRADFVRVQGIGDRVSTRHFVMLIARRVDDEKNVSPSRLGVVATKKVGDATMRNRIKRVCRECFRLWPNGLVPNGIDLVVIAREGADKLPLATVREEWQRAQISLLKRCEAVLRAPAKELDKAVLREKKPKPTKPDNRPQASRDAKKKSGRGR